MKSLFLILVLMIFGFASDIEGFRDMKWGDNPSKLGKTTIVEKHPEEKSFIYKKNNESFKIGETLLDGIFYDFFDNKLETVILKFSSKKSLDSLKQAFEEKYGGRGFIKQNKYIEEYYFVDGGPASISMNCNSSYSKCYIFISNTKILEEAEAYRKSVAKKGAKDL